MTRFRVKRKKTDIEVKELKGEVFINNGFQKSWVEFIP